MAAIDADARRRAAEVVNDLMKQTATSPMDVYGVSGGASEVEYLRLVGATYLRTVKDVLSTLPPPDKVVRVLEIGPYQGIVSRALSRLGFRVDVFEIPDILQSQQLRDNYDADSVAYQPGDLIDGNLPFDNETFDCVIICEVIEHLNFNPIPTLLEVNRVTKMGGYIYIGMPNQTRFGNRARAVLGLSTHEPVEMFFRLQCDPSFRVGLHWREYTLAETRKMFSLMGYRAVLDYYFANEDVERPSGCKGWLRLILQAFVPSFKGALVYIGTKQRNAAITWPPPAG